MCTVCVTSRDPERKIFQMADPYEEFNIGFKPVHTNKFTDPTGTGTRWTGDGTFCVNENS